MIVIKLQIGDLDFEFTNLHCNCISSMKSLSLSDNCIFDHNEMMSLLL